MRSLTIPLSNNELPPKVTKNISYERAAAWQIKQQVVCLSETNAATDCPVNMCIY